MKEEKEQLFDFEKIDGKWICKFNPKWFFYMFSTFGFPLEMSLEEVKERIGKMSDLELIALKLKCWKVFVEKNNIDVDEIKKEWQDKKDILMPKLEELAKQINNNK